MLDPARLGLSRLAVACLVLAGGARASAQAPPRQTEADDYTRYELLAPESARFRILYEVSATTPGAVVYFNPIRKGSQASDESVYDRFSGRPLRFEVVSGAEARRGGHPEAELDTDYLKIGLPRPVPRDGELRLLIDKTYRDSKSYFVEGERIVFSRSLGVKRNALVLPKGHELVSCNVPSQVLSEADGRILLSFMNASPADMPLRVEARRLP